MKAIFLTMILLVAAAAAFGQAEAKKPTELDKTAPIPSNAYLKRGEAIGKAEKVSLAKALEDPASVAGKRVRVEGVIVRSCQSANS